MTNRILSQAEIDALLPTANGSDDRAATSGVAAYDFCRPDRVTKDELRSVHFLHDRFALNVSTSLSAYLRAVTEVNIVSVEQFMYSEFLMSLPDTTAFYALDLDPIRMSGALEISPAVAFTIVDRMLGGSGGSQGPNRPLTEIEFNVIDTVVKVLIENLTDTWKPISSVTFRTRSRETRPQMLQVTDHNEIMIVLVFDVRLAENRGALHLCFPASAVEGMVETLAPGGQRARRDPNPIEQTWLNANLGRVPLAVTAELRMSLPTRELLLLRRGDVLSLPHAVSNPVDVRVGQVRRFCGRLTRQDNDTAGVLIERPASEMEPQESHEHAV